MVSLHRREFAGILLSLPFAGCSGAEIGYDDEGPVNDRTNDPDELDSETLEEIEEFSRTVTEVLAHAEEHLTDWLETPSDASLDALDTARIDATATQTRYGELVIPHLEEFKTLDETEFSWNGDPDQLIEALDTADSLLFHIQEATVGILDVDGNPRGVPSAAINSAEYVVEEAPETIVAIDASLP